MLMDISKVYDSMYKQTFAYKLNALRPIIVEALNLKGYYDVNIDNHKFRLVVKSKSRN